MFYLSLSGLTLRVVIIPFMSAIIYFFIMYSITLRVNLRYTKYNLYNFRNFRTVFPQKPINEGKNYMKYVTLSDGNSIPIVGLGTWRAQESEAAVRSALDIGYRHIDTAFNYNTEEAIGRVLQEYFHSGKLRRDEIFITTKLPNFGNRPKEVEKYIRLSLEKLKLDYVDLYLIHMPFSFQCSDSSFAPKVNSDGLFELDIENDLIATWKEMEKLVKLGLTKSIGLSNFNQEQVQRIYDANEIKPAVLQVEMHAYLQQKELQEACRKLNVAITAYAPLGSPGANTHMSTKYNYTVSDFPDILGHPVVQELAGKYKKSPGQILLRHLVQHDIIVIPKSVNPERIKSNIDIFDFDISHDDMEKLDGLDKQEDGRIFDFLFFKGVEKHPEYPFKVRRNA